MRIISKQFGNYSFIDWYLPIFYILAQYSYGLSNLGLIIFILYSIIALVNGNKLVFHKPLSVFILFISLIQFINMFARGNLSLSDFNNLFMPLIMLVILSMAISKVNYRNLYAVYTFVGCVAMSILYYQSFKLTVYGILPSPVNILPVSSAGFYSWQSEYYRPSSLFTEPQAYASYMLPLLIMSLRRKRIVFSSLIILSILLCGSSLGIAFAAYLAARYFIDSKNIGLVSKGFFLLLLASTLYAFIYTEIFSSQIAKIASINLANDIRLVKGFQIYSTFSELQMLFGIGDGPNVLEAYNRANASKLLSLSIFDLGSYVTTASGLLIGYGAFSFILYTWLIYRMYRYEDKSNRIFAVIIAFASFGQTILFNGFFLLYYATYFGLNNKHLYNKNYGLKWLKIKKIT